MIRPQIFILSFLIATAITGCNYSAPNPSDTSTSGTASIEKLPPGTIPGYQTVATGIIAPKCLGCHSAAGGNSGGINLETYNNVKAHFVAVDSAVKSGSMPIGTSLTAKQKEVFLAWLDAGGPLDAPAVAADPTPVVPTPVPLPAPTPTPAPPIVVVPAPNKIDYKLVNTNVLSPRCISCHSDSGGNSAGINLETYENVFNERSTIKSVIANGSMPLPRNRPLTATQKQMILNWLNQGAPETVP